MSNKLLASKIVSKEEPPTTRNIPAEPTSIMLAVGVAERGPIGVATVVTSWPDYQSKFGYLTANAKDLPNAVKAYFDGGGARAHVTRVVHYADPSVASSKTSAAATGNIVTAALAATAAIVLGTIAGPWSLADGDTLSFDVDGGGSDVATFNAAAASEESANTATYDLADSLTLTVKVDQGAVQTITFLTAEFADITNATALEVAAVINAKISGASATVTSGGTKITITSDKLGTGSYVEITGGTANVGGANRLAFPTAEVQGTGDAVDASAVTAAEMKTLIEADVAGVAVSASAGGFLQVATTTTGAASSLLCEAASTADSKFGFDNATHDGTAGGAINTLQVDGKTDGAYANDVTVTISTASSGEADEFNVTINEGGVPIEVWPNVSMTDADVNYIETVINKEGTGSNLVTFTDLAPSLTSPDDRPANGTYSLSGGSDGLTSLDDNDFVGSATSKTGMRAFDYQDEGRILIVPGRATSAVHNAMVAYCETTRGGSIFPVLDPPEGYSAAQMKTYVRTTALLKELSEFGAIYWPRIKISNPSKTIYGNVSEVVVPPSGHIAGMYARTDSAFKSGVFEAPAGVSVGRLIGATGVETNEVNDESKRDLIYPELINPIVALEGLPVHVDGSRTLKSTSNFPTIGERRGVIFVTQSLKSGTLWAKHRKIKRRTRKEIARSWFAFLLTQTRNGAFASDVPAEAFYVDVGDALNTAITAFDRKIFGRFGIATAKPAEFIIILVTQDTRALEEELLAAA